MKRMNALLASLLAAAIALPATASAQGSNSSTQGQIQVYMDQQKLNFDVPPVNQEGTTLVQFRTIFEKLGYSVKWNQSNRSVTAFKEGTTIVLYINVKKAYINNVEVSLEKAPAIINGSTLVPLRFVSETSGRTVMWYGNTRTIAIGNAVITPSGSPTPSPTPVPTATQTITPTPSATPSPTPTPTATPTPIVTPIPTPMKRATEVGDGYRGYVSKDGKMDSGTILIDRTEILGGLMSIYYDLLPIKTTEWPNVDGFIEVRSAFDYTSVRDEIRSETDWDSFVIIHNLDNTKQYEYSSKSKKRFCRCRGSGVSSDKFNIATTGYEYCYAN
ncbi:copper amine oxidase N-terminal domain-containing protein [Cohnella rhizosphaerae]|uniref:Copper amine oxidase N-terminal domain-containing protein n=1 Tax=Cohnella rhizosphaerae TaxID=1457232 RepID=A0A9X4L3J3_9BACL|nr:copper amine oxidase N-terminal domain-containing protein [Cohnella rhizosphaerae]MDG0812812.1 copper amine oxidase N-terminal domain-containing protein [Cohnella rhizosphaerae]